MAELELVVVGETALLLEQILEPAHILNVGQVILATRDQSDWEVAHILYRD